ncbi:efflux RND transporter permease subunit [Amnibacterium sp. CER49]|uniref:efflux RND transporter permease subunit n=1 Tax=Amnibacterium sp. CER49 TaxID=3039161 RepID=UPI002447B35B|nr:efflux RND transporter permease subunit [Amnibacterium sp. CER49]MDH2443741.1 efflux RND transporter permease subunit [Amnibacterium sp. CER49]
MHLLAAFSLRNRALIALVTVVAAVFGLLAAGGLQEELIPSVQFPQLAVVTTYRGATPTVVNQRVSLPIEQAIRGIAGLESSASTSSSGSSTVTASFTYGTDLDAAEQKIGSAINRIRATLPDGTDPQIIAGSLADIPVTVLAVTGDRSADQLASTLRASVVPDLEKLAGVRAANLAGAPQARVTITPKAALEDHRLQPTVIEDTLKASGVLVPAGSVTEGGTTRSIQVGTELGSTSDIAALPLAGVTAAQYNGPLSTSTRVPTIGDVATVATNHDPVTTVSLVNGRPALTVAVTKLPSANTVTVSREVRAELARLQPALGPNGRFTPVFDQAPYIEQSIASLRDEGLLGLAFAVLVILVFLLSLRATLVTAVSIPVSLLITLIGMQAVGYSLNILTLGAITIAIGRVVDDSIVVTENIARHFREDEEDPADEGTPAERRRASIFAATREVAGAVTASTVTTVAVFVPIAFVGGTAGELFRPFALTVTLALGASLLVALTIVPVLAYWFLRPRRVDGRPARRPLLQRAYRPVLGATLAHPWLTTIAAVLVLAGSGFLATLLPTNYLGSSGQNTLTVTETVPDGTSLAVQTVRARAAGSAIRAVPGVRIVEASVGTSGNPFRDAFNASSGTRITYSVTTDPKAGQDALQRRIRRAVDTLPGGGTFTLAASQGFGAASDIQIDVTAGTASALRAGADQVLRAVQHLPEVSQASSNLASSQAYLAVDIDAAKAAAAGYSEVALAQVVARASQPASIGSVTIGDDDLTVYLAARKAPTTRSQLAALDVPTPTGTKRLDSLATIRIAKEPAGITTADAKRSATVSATPAGSNTGAASAAVAKALAGVTLPAGVSASLGGLTSDQNTTFQQLGLALLAAILIVYTVMVATFRSLRQPLELLVSVPFAATGAILLQLASGIPLGAASLIGVVMLVGIVVTNAIVLIDLVNQYRARGETVRDAVLDGATRRLRPILMTALATILALVPTATGLSGNGGFISQPLALVVIGGLVSSTVLTLLVLPTLYFLVEGRRERAVVRRERRAERRAAAAAAIPAGS